MSSLRRLAAGLSLRNHGFAPGSIHMGFVVDEVALRKVFFSGFFGFPLSVSSNCRSSYSCIIRGINNMSVSGSSSEM
jgi:hypothetical protein